MMSIGVLTRILDGQGYTSDSGAQGRRGYREKYKFMWLAATTPIPYRVWDVMSTLGTKIYFLHVPETQWTEEEQLEWFLEDTYQDRITKAQQATAEFLLYLKGQTPIKWIKKNDPIEVLKVIQNLSRVLSRLRGKVNVATKTVFDEMGRERVAIHTTPIIEDPMRAFIMLHTLATGHAFVRGRRQLSEEDISYIIEVALSSAPKDRVEAFKALLRNGGILTSKRLMQITRCSRHTAIRALKTLSILKLTQDVGQTISGREITGHIRKDMAWCVDDKYMQAWGAKRAPKKPLKHRETTEGLEIFDDERSKHKSKTVEGHDV